MKKIICLIFVVFVLLLLVSCGNKDEVANEIIHYYNEEWVPINDMKEKEMRGLAMEMNDLQIEAEEFAKDALKVINAYYDGDDDVTEQDINQNDEELQEKYDAILDYRDELMDEYNLEQVENKDENSELYKLKRAED